MNFNILFFVLVFICIIFISLDLSHEALIETLCQHMLDGNESSTKWMTFFINEMKTEFNYKNDYGSAEFQNIFLSSLNEHINKVHLSNAHFSIGKESEYESLISFGTYYFNKSNGNSLEHILIYLLKKLQHPSCNPDTECRRNEFLQNVWTLIASDPNSNVNILDSLCENYPNYIMKLIMETIGNVSQMDYNGQLDPILLKLNVEFLKLSKLCRKSQRIFQETIQQVAKHMIDNSFPQNDQIFITCLLDDLKDRMKISDLRQLYDDRLINFIYILESSDDTNTKAVEHTLNYLKDKNFIDFIILITHFPKYLHLRQLN